MTLELGPHEGVIVSHRSRTAGDKDVIAINCDVGGEPAEAVIYLTEKSFGMARAALKICGFDVDKTNLVELDLNPTMLAGRKVPLMVDEYNGKTQIKIDINQRVDKARLGSLTQRLRDVKKKGKDSTEPAPPQTKGEGAVEPDYGIPFALLICSTLSFMVL